VVSKASVVRVIPSHVNQKGAAFAAWNTDVSEVACGIWIAGESNDQQQVMWPVPLAEDAPFP